MAGTGSDETCAFRDRLTRCLLEAWPDDVPPDPEALRWAVAAATKTWAVTHARFGFRHGLMERWTVQTPWTPVNESEAATGVRAVQDVPTGDVGG